MNFQDIPPVDMSKDLLDMAFRKARSKGQLKNLKGNWLQIIRKKEALKLDVVKDSIVPRLQKVLATFPGIDHLSKFYLKLLDLTLDYSKFKKSCGAVSWAITKVRGIHKDYVRKIAKEKEKEKINFLTKQFYGRVSSVLKQIDPNLDYLNKCRKIMKNYPDIKDMFTVCIYGFPNVGKTTLLNKLTGTTAKTAAYAFTTVGINAGYKTISGTKVQFLDVPGTLSRKDKMNKIELQAELVMEEIADVIIFVFDLSEYCGFSVDMQQKLFEKLKGRKVFAYVSKQDLLKDELDDFKLKHFSLKDIKEKISKEVK
jgi:nucleolar GTP-binding protein